MTGITGIIDGREVTVEPGSTIFDAASRVGVHIPTLCHITDGCNENPSCGICAVQVEGMEGFIRSCETLFAQGMKVVADSKEIGQLRKGILEKLGESHFGDCKAPCNLTCPGQINVQGYIGHVAKGQYAEATRLIMERNPFPFSVGRVCPRFCETRCRRILVDEPVSINHLKRFVADWCMANKVDLHIEREPATGKRVAIIGGGPAGLTGAYFLACKGHDVTIFEKMPKLGGMLRYGIPEYKIPRKVLDYEINGILRMGVSVRLGQSWGEDFTLKDLRDGGYDAILVTVGAGVDQLLEIPGANLPGVIPATRFLHDVCEGAARARGKRAAVVGGNNIAMEVARSLIRLGVEEVTVIYPRAKLEMPANQRNIREAEREGVQFLLMASPVQIVKTEKGLDIELIRMKLGEPDKKGIRYPEAIPGSTIFLQVDTIVSSLGQMAADGRFKGAELEDALELSAKNTIQANARTSLTSVENIYAAGDAVSGPRSVIQAVVASRRAAENIHAHLTAGNKDSGDSRFNFTRGKSFENVDLRVFEGIKVKLREKMPERPPEICTQDFDEARLGFTEQMARREAARCLSCGCLAFDRCDYKEHCITNGMDPNKVHTPAFPLYSVDNDHHAIGIDLNKCIYCGRCAKSCRYDGIDLSVEKGGNGRISLRFNDRCVSCGKCVDACSTGALVKKDILVPITGEAVRHVRSTCPYCGTGCQILLKVKGDTIMEVGADKKRPPNYGDLCVKGRFGHSFVQHPDRLTGPLVRRSKGGVLEPASWEEALDLVAGAFRCIVADYGPDALGGLASARCTNEENYAFQKFFRAVIGTNNIDHCARY